MLLLNILLHISIAYAQNPPTNIPLTSECLISCLRHRSVIFTSNNLRNFESITLSIDNFCKSYEELTDCAKSCDENDQYELKKQIGLSNYICNEKIEEFRLASECMQSQEIGIIDKCSNDCQEPANTTLQLDSTPEAPVNPFTFVENIVPICNKLECTVKCSIMELNKKCAGSGELFKDIGLKQVIDASIRLNNDAENSTSTVAAQMAKIYLQSLPKSCSFIIDPLQYDVLFTAHENEGSAMVTEVASINEFSEVTNDNEDTHTFNAEEPIFTDDIERLSTRIFDVEIESTSPKPSVASEDVVDMANFPHEIDTSPDREPEPTKSTMETSDTEAAVFKTKNEVVMTTEPNNVGASNEAERTIMVVNEDENQIVKNEVMNTDREKVSQMNAAKKWTIVPTLILGSFLIFLL